MPKVFEWNGRDLPAELKALPPGRYVLEVIDDDAQLSPEEEAEMEEALASVERGEGISGDVVSAELDALRREWLR